MITKKHLAIVFSILLLVTIVTADIVQTSIDIRSSLTSAEQTALEIRDITEIVLKEYTPCDEGYKCYEYLEGKSFKLESRECTEYTLDSENIIENCIKYRTKTSQEIQDELDTFILAESKRYAQVFIERDARANKTIVSERTYSLSDSK